jgi:methionine synthase II (cobalamin-independent)
MITYEKNAAMQQYVNEIAKAGEIVRNAKKKIFNIDEKVLGTTEEAYTRSLPDFDVIANATEKLSKQNSTHVCNAFIRLCHLLLNHPELINDIEYQLNTKLHKI